MSMWVMDQELESKGTNNRPGAQCSEVSVASQFKQTSCIPTNDSDSVAWEKKGGTSEDGDYSFTDAAEQLL